MNDTKTFFITNIKLIIAFIHKIEHHIQKEFGVYRFADMFESAFYHFASIHPAVTKVKLKLKLKLLSLLTKFAIDSSLRCHDMKERQIKLVQLFEQSIVGIAFKKVY